MSCRPLFCGVVNAAAFQTLPDKDDNDFQDVGIGMPFVRLFA